MRWKYVSLLLGTACLLAGLLCGVGAIAVRRGIVSPPTLNLHVGLVGIEAGLTERPECPPHCEGQKPASEQRIYSVWFVSTTMDISGEHTSARLLFTQPLR